MRITSSRVTRSRNPAAIFGAIPLLVGLAWFIATASGAMRWEVPQSIGLLVSVMLIILGAAVLQDAWAGLASRRRSRGRSPSDPMGDHPWDGGGAPDESPAIARKQLTAFLVFASFLAPFHWQVLHGGLPAWAFVFIVPLFGLMDLLISFFLWDAIRHIRATLAYGPIRLDFGRFPFAPGSDLQATLRVARPPRDVRLLRFKLTAIQERPVGKKSPERAIAKTLYEDTESVFLPPSRPWEVPIAFQLPADAPSTDLSADSPRYWVLEVENEPPEPLFRASFLVPVYRMR